METLETPVECVIRGSPGYLSTVLATPHEIENVNGPLYSIDLDGVRIRLQERTTAGNEYDCAGSFCTRLASKLPYPAHIDFFASQRPHSSRWLSLSSGPPQCRCVGARGPAYVRGYRAHSKSRDPFRVFSMQFVSRKIFRLMPQTTRSSLSQRSKAVAWVARSRPRTMRYTAVHSTGLIQCRIRGRKSDPLGSEKLRWRRRRSYCCMPRCPVGTMYLAGGAVQHRGIRTGQTLTAGALSPQLALASQMPAPPNTQSAAASGRCTNVDCHEGQWRKRQSH